MGHGHGVWSLIPLLNNNVSSRCALQSSRFNAISIRENLYSTTGIIHINNLPSKFTQNRTPSVPLLRRIRLPTHTYRVPQELRIRPIPSCLHMRRSSTRPPRTMIPGPSPRRHHTSRRPHRDIAYLVGRACGIARLPLLDPA